MTNKKQIKSTAIAGLIGVGVGVAVGILTAPKSGKETRKDIVDGSVKLKDELFKRYHDVQTSLSEAIDHAISQLNSFKGSSKESLEDLIAKAKDAEFKALDIFRAVKAGESDNKDLDKAVDHANKAKENLVKYLNK